MMLDYTGGMKPYQDKLDAAGVDFDISIYAGATQPEIERAVRFLIAQHHKQQLIQEEKSHAGMSTN